MSDTPWAETQYEYDVSNQPIYEGRHKTEGASDSDNGWYIWRYTWSSGNMIRKQGAKIGSWNNRTEMF